MRAGDVYAARAGHRRRRRLLVGVVQRGHPSLRQPGRQRHADALAYLLTDTRAYLYSAADAWGEVTSQSLWSRSPSCGYKTI